MHRLEKYPLRALRTMGYLPKHKKRLKLLSYVNPDPSSDSAKKYLETGGKKGWIGPGFKTEKRLFAKMKRQQKKEDLRVKGWIPLVVDGIKYYNALAKRLVATLTNTCGCASAAPPRTTARPFATCKPPRAPSPRANHRAPLRHMQTTARPSATRRRVSRECCCVAAHSHAAQPRGHTPGI